MRFLFVLVVIILIGGVALYGMQMMGIQIPYVSQYFANMPPSDHSGHGGHQMPGMQGGQITASPFNNLASQNKDKLIQGVTILNQAMELITNDPYAQITQPNTANAPAKDNSGIINIPPRDGITINISPGGQQRREFPANIGNIVYDQAKLEQLHNGLFKFSQALMLLNELNNDLTDQSVMSESNPPTADTYVIRYNLLQQNRTKLVQANRLLQESLTMVNVNPYAPADGYIYNAQKMQQLHQGIMELARSASILSQLSDNFNQQMLQVSNESRLSRVQISPNATTAMNGMNMNNMQHGSMIREESSWILNLALIIIVFAIVLGILILIKRLLNDFKVSQ